MIFASSSVDHFDCFFAGEVVGRSVEDAVRFRDWGCGRRLEGDGLARDDCAEAAVEFAAGVLYELPWAFDAELAPPVTEVATVEGREGMDAVDLAAGEAEEERARSSSPLPGRASFGLRRSEISTFVD